MKLRKNFARIKPKFAGAAYARVQLLLCINADFWSKFKSLPDWKPALMLNCIFILSFLIRIRFLVITRQRLVRKICFAFTNP